jgi:hypothetical protein
VHDLTAARIRGVIQALAACGLVLLGHKGYLGEDCIRTPYRAEQARPAEGANRAHARLRTLVERANAQLKSWRILRKLRCCPGAPDRWPKRFTFSRRAKSENEKAH